MHTVIAASPPPGPGADYPLAAAFMPLCDRAAGSSEHAAAAREIARQVLALPTPTPYLATCAHVGLGLIAVAEGDPDGAAGAYAAIAPVEGEMLVLPAVSRDRVLALLAGAAGRLEEALAHFERALDFCTRAGYRPEQAWIAAEYADALARRDAPGDTERADTLRRRSRALARELGLPSRAPRGSLAGRH
jgi:tetratricopeptide (TPR) repeat protein